MAKDKNGFILYKDLVHTVGKLSNEQAGSLFKIILAYVNDQNPVIDDPLMDIVFEPIKQSLIRDLRSWKEEKESRSLSGRLGNLKRWHPEEYKKVVEGSEPTNNEYIANDRTAIDSSQPVANIAVSVIDSVIVRDRDISDQPVKIPEGGRVKVKEDDQIVFPIDQCLEIAMRHDKWVKQSGATKEELGKFNQYLVGISEEEKNPADYKAHFYRWKKKGGLGGAGDKQTEEKKTVSQIKENQTKDQLSKIYGPKKKE